jgi:quercetin dioxygenase-like cupin family protein
MEGELLFQIGDRRMQLKVGDSVLAPRKVPHTFTAVGTRPGKLLIAFSPAGKMEQFFRDATRKDAPPQDAAFYRKYGMEVVGPPIK